MNPNLEQSHHDAARYLESAAKHHKLAAEHFARQDVHGGIHAAHLANAYFAQAEDHHRQAAKHFLEHHQNDLSNS